MRIGIVSHCNARPLTYGFEKNPEYITSKENPAKLAEKLLNNELDAALISSVEVFRNSHVLSASYSCGVCAGTSVKSILYYHGRKENNPPEEIFVDSGSRSSVALLKLLIRMTHGIIPATIPVEPEKILKSMMTGFGNYLLIGDNALDFQADEELYAVYDLAEWWNRETSLPFCFALWAYPKEKPLPDSLFLDSLRDGLKNLDSIISEEHRYSNSILKEYFTEDLHYFLDDNDRSSLSLFEELLRKYGLLEISQ